MIHVNKAGAETRCIMMIESFDQDGRMAHSRLIETFHAQGTLHTYAKKATIFLTGDSPDYVYLVASGLVKVATSTIEGKDITFFLRNAGDVFGFSEILLDQPRQRLAQTLKPSSLWTLPRTVFSHILHSEPSFTLALLRISSLRLLKTQETVEALVGHSVAWRLGHFLLQEAQVNEDGQIGIALNVTHAEIARLIGTSRQSVTEQLNRWISLGTIHWHGKSLIILRPDALTTDF